MDFSIKVWLSLPCNLLMHQKNALHTLYNQNLLFLTVPSRSDDLLCCQLKLLHFLLLLFYLIFFFCIFIFSSVEFWLTGTFFVDVGFIGSSFRKIFILSLCSPSVFVSLLLFLLGVDADDVFMVVKLFFNFHCLYRYAFAFYSWPSIL